MSRDDFRDIPRPDRVFADAEFHRKFTRPLRADPAAREVLRSGELLEALPPMMSHVPVMDRLTRMAMERGDMWVLSLVTQDVVHIETRGQVVRIPEAEVSNIIQAAAGTLGHLRVSDLETCPYGTTYFHLEGEHPAQSEGGQELFQGFYARFGESILLNTSPMEELEKLDQIEPFRYLQIQAIRRPKEPGNLLDEAYLTHVFSWQKGTSQTIHEAILRAQNERNKVLQQSGVLPSGHSFPTDSKELEPRIRQVYPDLEVIIRAIASALLPGRGRAVG